MNVVLCIQILADSNSSLIEKEFQANTESIDIAYRPYQYFYKKFKGINFLCIEAEIGDAKLWMWKYWFFPAIDECRFNDLMLDLETTKIDLHEALEWNKKLRKKILIGTGSGLVLGIIGGILISYKVRN